MIRLDGAAGGRAARTRFRVAPVAHPGFRYAFPAGRMTLGIALPEPSGKERPAEFARRVEAAGFGALWLPPSALGHSGGRNAADRPALEDIAEGTRKLPMVVCLAAADAVPSRLAAELRRIDARSGGRLMVSAALAAPEQADHRDGARTRLGRFHALLRALQASGEADARCLPVIITGSCHQSLGWIAEHCDGWRYKHCRREALGGIIAEWRRLVGAGRNTKPFIQALALELSPDPDAIPERTGCGLRTGRRGLVTILESLAESGVNHAVLDLRATPRPAREMVAELAAHVVKRF